MNSIDLQSFFIGSGSPTVTSSLFVFSWLFFMEGIIFSEGVSTNTVVISPMTITNPSAIHVNFMLIFVLLFCLDLISKLKKLKK